MLETSIITNLIHNKEYWDLVLPHIKPEYFESQSSKVLFDIIFEHSDKYHSQANIDILKIQTSKMKINENLLELVKSDLKEISKKPEPINAEFLVDETEQWMKDRAIYNVIFDSINIYEDSDRHLELGQIPERMNEALSVCLREDLGSVYWEDSGKQWDKINLETHKIPFLSETLNIITNGGAETKSLNALSAGINVGKTTGLISLAADYAELGYDVVYFSAEISEEKVHNRFDPRTSNKEFSYFRNLNKVEYVSKMNQIRKSKGWGQIFIKELPSGNVNDMRAYVKNLMRKRGIKPRVFMFDYLGEFTSARLPIHMMAKTDLYYGSIARELRAFMFEMDGLGWTATQLQRSAQSTSEMGLDNTADSITVPKVLDFQMGIYVPEEYVDLKMAHCVVMKSRYGNKPSFQMMLDQDIQTLSDPQTGVSILGGKSEGRKNISDSIQSSKEESAPKQKVQRLSKTQQARTFNNDIKV